MRLSALAYATVAAGIGIAVAGAIAASHEPLTALALLGAAALAAELLEEALAEIEAHIGSQFHPAIAKAFVAVQRGLDPYSVLTPEEQDELRGAAAPRHVPELPGAGDLRERPELLALGGLAAALTGVGLHQLWLVSAGAVLAWIGLVLRGWARYRAGRLGRALTTVLAVPDRETVFARLADLLHSAGRADWVGLVDWEEDGLGGSLERSRGEAEPRDRLPAPSAQELDGSEGVCVALPLRRENIALVGFVVLRAPRVLPRPVRTALSDALDTIGVALAGQPSKAPCPRVAAVS